MSSTQTPLTIREMLERAMQRDGYDEGSYANLYSLPPYFSRYGLRTTGGAFDFTHNQMRELLRSSTHLYLPEQLFCGFATSQPLLGLDERQSEQPNIFASLVPKHAGTDLHEVVSLDRVTGSTNKVHLVRHLLAHPEKLELLFDQAAFLAMQPVVKDTPDYKLDNIMVDRSYNLSLIDTLSPEDTEPSHASQEIRRSYAKACIGIGRRGLHTALLVLTQGSQLSAEEKDSFKALLARCEERTIENINKHTLPDWKGMVSGHDLAESIAEEVNERALNMTGEKVFEEVNGTQAIRLDAPARSLKLALDRIYAEALPAQGAGR